MPVQKCQVNGKSGWRWGSEGKCYTGKGAKKKAIKQGLAIGDGKLAENSFEHFTSNLSNAVRHDTMADREYLVAPMVMLTEGVHNGTNGPLLYPSEELSKTPEVWNHKPIVVYHPTIEGQGVSACDPDILTSRKVGVIMNTRFEDGKLRAEAWLEKDRLEKVDERVLGALEESVLMEVSTGLFTDNDFEEGEWGGEKYKSIARNYKPDHLALLPDLVGACSIADGAGLLQLNSGKYDKTTLDRAARKAMRMLEHNEASHGNVRDQLRVLLDERFGKETFVWLEEIYSSFFIYEYVDKLWKLEYTLNEDKVELSSSLPTEVEKVTEYRTLDGSVVGNSSKESEMSKEELVKSLIENELTKFEKDDSEWLSSLEEDQLLKLNIEKPAPTASDPKPSDPKPTENISQEDPPKETTVDEFILNAPEGIRDVLYEGLRSHNQEKAQLVKAITSNERNVFGEEILKQKPLSELRAIAALAAKEEDTDNSTYVGAAGAVFNNTEHEEEALELPVMTW